METRITPAIFTVTTTVDFPETGVSLRDAISSANETSEADTINFDLSTSDPGYNQTTGTWTISPIGPLPAITNPVLIDGYSQSGASPNTLSNSDNANIKVILNGNSFLEGGGDGLTIDASSSTVQGLSIINFSGSAIFLEASGGSTIQGNFLGLSADGTTAGPNGEYGVRVESSANTIGGTDPAARNLISANGASGIGILGSSATGNMVLGNFIGLNAAGTSGTGSGDVGNLERGIQVDSGGNTIGDGSQGGRNVISGNHFSGIRLAGSDAAENSVLGNYIGLNAAGTAAVGNFLAGIRTNDAPVNTFQGNVVSGNIQGGFQIFGVGSTGNQLLGNWIGTNPAGTAIIGNGEDGVDINLGASDNAIGGLAPGAGNIIQGNGNNGIFIGAAGTNSNGSYPDSIQNPILSNSIYANVLLGIDLNTDGVSPNDPGDPDTGGNNTQNFPVLTRAVALNGATFVQGVFNSQPNQTYTIQFFSNDLCDPSGYGEGQSLLATRTVTTGPGGNATFAFTLPASTNPGQFVTATATDPNGNTSEFSACQLVEQQSVFQFSSPTYTVPETAGSAAITVIRTGGGSVPATVVFSTDGGTATPGVDYVPVTTTLSFTSGQTSQVVYIPILDNLDSEVNHTVLLNLSDPQDFAILGPQSTAQLTIENVLATTVTNTQDSGRGSLRQAINAANAFPDRNLIDFQIPGPGPHVIQPGSPLPVIVNPVDLNATTEPGFSGLPNVIVDGANAGSGVNGLVVAAGNSTVRGLTVRQFGGSGILLYLNGGNTIAGNQLVGNLQEGLFISEVPNNIIGGTTPQDRNIISLNGFGGIQLVGAGASGNQVLGNFIGTDITGTQNAGNVFDGVYLNNAPHNVIGGTVPGARNLISGGNSNGVRIFGAGASGNQVLGNFIGTDVTGNQALGNLFDGVFIDSAPNNTIGGTDPAARNVISGNGSVGVQISGSGASGNQVLGNFIGASASGTDDLGNGSDGVFLNNAPNNTIGGEGNLIAGNGQYGLEITGASATGNIVLDNIFRNNALGPIFISNPPGAAANTITTTNTDVTADGMARPLTQRNQFLLLLQDRSRAAHQAHFPFMTRLKKTGRFLAFPRLTTRSPRSIPVGHVRRNVVPGTPVPTALQAPVRARLFGPLGVLLLPKRKK